MKPPGWYIAGPNKSLKTERIEPIALAVLDGCLLGDGSYIQRSVHTASFSLSQCLAHVGWINDLHVFFETHGITSMLNSGVYRRKGREFPYVKIRTYSLTDLLPQRQRWYPHGKKIVPSDLDLSNGITLAQWHMGDGNVSIQRGRLEVKLHTNGFTEDDVHLLIGKLSGVGIHGFIIHWRSQPIITIQHKHAEKFIDLTRPHMSSCFSYKVPVNPWKPSCCIKCKLTITGPCGEKHYAKYCDNCASPRMKKFRSMTKEARELHNLRKREARKYSSEER